MAKLKVLPKRFEELDSMSDDCYFRINIDVLNEAFGVGRSMYAKAVYPDKVGQNIIGTDGKKYFIWMPKLYSNSSEWKNSISSDESMIYEDAEGNRHEDWTDPENNEIADNMYRIVFVKPSAKEPYKFVGIFKAVKLDYLHHAYKRVATKIKLIGMPAMKIEILE